MGEVPGPWPGLAWGQGVSWLRMLACIWHASPACLPQGHLGSVCYHQRCSLERLECPLVLGSPQKSGSCLFVTVLKGAL